jgi:hypothetical protein
MNKNDDLTPDGLITHEIRLVLDEKRTSISVLVTGVSILLAQLIIQGFLIATSQFYKIIDVLHIVIPFYIINIALFFLSFYLIIHSLLRIRHYNRLILQLKKRHSVLSDFTDL